MIAVGCETKSFKRFFTSRQVKPRAKTRSAESLLGLGWLFLQ